MSKHIVYLPDYMSEEIQQEAERLNKSLSWVLAVSWGLAGPMIKTEPSPDTMAFDLSLPEDVEAVWRLYPEMPPEKPLFFRTMSRLGLTVPEMQAACSYVAEKVRTKQKIRSAGALVYTLCKKRVNNRPATPKA